MPNKYTKIGDILAAARREQNKTVKEAAETTKIMAKYLEAVEAGDPTQLPSVTYFLLFARSYAQYLGIDPAILEEIEVRNGEQAFELPVDEDDNDRVGESDGTESEKQTKSLLKTLVYIISAAVLLFAAFVVYNLVFVAEKDEPTGDEAISTALIEDDAQIAEDSATEPEMVITPYEPPGKLDLHLRARQDVWVVVAKDGDTVLNRQLGAGEERRWQADYRYLLTLGISTAVELTLNGTRLAPLSDRAQTITGLEINQVNYRKFFPPEGTEEIAPSRVIPERPKFQVTETAADTTGEGTGDGH